MESQHPEHPEISELPAKLGRGGWQTFLVNGCAEGRDFVYECPRCDRTAMMFSGGTCNGWKGTDLRGLLAHLRDHVGAHGYYVFRDRELRSCQIPGEKALVDSAGHNIYVVV